MNAAIDSTENMDTDDSKTGNESTGKDSDKLSPKKADDRKDVGSDVGTSMMQQKKPDDNTGSPVENESDHKDVSINEELSEDIAMNSHSEEEKQTRAEQTEVESGPEEVESSEKDVVDVDDIDLDDIPLGKKYGGSVAKRLRSNTGKVVISKTGTSMESVGSMSEDPSVKDTPKTRSKTTGVGPKRGWSKVKKGENHY